VRARDLADAAMVVADSITVREALTRLAEHRWDGLVVVDDAARLVATVSLSQVGRLLLPAYVLQTRALSAVLDLDAVAGQVDDLAGHSLRQAVRGVPDSPVQVAVDATALETLVVMARAPSAVVAVTDGDEVLGAVDVHTVLRRLAEAASTGHDSSPVSRP
jgi:CBS domain-containing protein